MGTEDEYYEDDDGYRKYERERKVVQDIVDYREGKTTHLYDDGTYDEEYDRSGPCFIATAAFGTPLAREIDFLRAYRDEKLASNQLGRSLVSTYYLLSPAIAFAVARTNPLRGAVRVLVRCIVARLRKD